MSNSRLSVRQDGNHTLISGLDCFSPADTLDCGQAFRFSPLGDGRWQGIAHGRQLVLSYSGNTLILYDTPQEEFERIWRGYFDLDRDYAEILEAISGHEILREAGNYAKGLRLLRQDPWEALCSFIISQNNNIPRIKGIVERLCAAFGKPAGSGFSFPSAERLAALSVDDLAPLRSGFRAKYILDAAKKVAGGEVDLPAMASLPLEDARASLMTILGVGPKVADCALLFGSGRIECFPKDVWIKKVMAELFHGTLPACAVPYAGIVQQYLFHYARTGDVFASA